MNINLKRIILAILIIINCIVIFMFSGQDAEKSSDTSGVVVNKVVDTISTVNKKVKKKTLKSQITFYVRKLAHFSIYTLLGFLLVLEVNTFRLSYIKRIIIPLFMGVLYAFTDEFHQSFISGRSAEIRDVFIDGCGVLFGIIIACFCIKIIKKLFVREHESSV